MVYARARTHCCAPLQPRLSCTRDRVEGIQGAIVGLAPGALSTSHVLVSDLAGPGNGTYTPADQVLPRSSPPTFWKLLWVSRIALVSLGSWDSHRLFSLHRGVSEARSALGEDSHSWETPCGAAVQSLAATKCQNQFAGWF